MEVPVNVMKLFSKSATYDSTEKSYQWNLTTGNSNVIFNCLRVFAVDMAISNKTFDNEPLPTLVPVANPILDGDYTSFTLPSQLATLFGALGCTIPATTNVITLTFGGAVTLQISAWSPRARSFLGSGDADLSGASITFPYPCNLGGDLEYNFQFQDGLTNQKDVRTMSTSVVGSGDVGNCLTVPAEGNGLDFVFYRPDNLWLSVDTAISFQTPKLIIRDTWNNPLDMRQGPFYVELHLHQKRC